ncbi:putative nuclease [uncultured Mediterranean phage uvMED]|nr:putative nuclease [uncultured Mediterranean phage uvMED]
MAGYSRTCHAYDEDANPIFHLTLAQAKKEGLFLSVTTMQSVLGKPALEFWKLNEHLKTAHQHPPRAGEDEQSFIKRIKGQTWKNTGGAAELGTAIHAGIESVLLEEKDVGDLDVDMQKYVAPAIRYFRDKKFKIEAVEKTIVNADEGYGGMVDAVGFTSCGKKFILDWKSRKFNGRKAKPYDGQPEQCSAYGAGYFGVEAINEEKIWGLNAFIATDQFTTGGEAEFSVTSYTPQEMKYHYETFCHTAELWRRMEGYDPRKEKA